MLKVGDKVVCTKDDISYMNYLKIGRTYTINWIFHDNTILLEDDDYDFYSIDCFKLDTKYYRRKKLKKLYNV